jgi:hypothetical protein
MPEIGQNLSHYSITGKIGKGGMGEVYRATDCSIGKQYGRLHQLINSADGA